MNQTYEKRLTRLKTIVSLHEEKKEVLAQIRRMREWVMEVEHIFDGSWVSQEEEISNAEVGWRLDDWLVRLSVLLQARLPDVAPASWWQVRQETRNCHQEQLNRYRFRHRPLAYLAS